MDGYDGADHNSIASSKAVRFLLGALDVKRLGAGGGDYALNANSQFGAGAIIGAVVKTTNRISSEPCVAHRMQESAQITDSKTENASKEGAAPV